MPAKFLKNGSPKNICDVMGLDLAKLSETRPVPEQHLYDLYGRVNRVRQGSGTYGPWIKFQGEFEIVTRDGETITAGAVHIPVLEDVLYAKLDEVRAADPRGFLDVALRVSIKPAKPGKPSATGYEFDVQPLLPTSSGEDSPIKRLRKQVSDLQALPAPAEAEQPPKEPTKPKK